MEKTYKPNKPVEERGIGLGDDGSGNDGESIIFQVKVKVYSS